MTQSQESHITDLFPYPQLLAYQNTPRHNVQDCTQNRQSRQNITFLIHYSYLNGLVLYRLQLSGRTLRTIRASTCELGQIKLIGLLCVSFPCESDNTFATNTESWSALRLEVCEVLPHTHTKQTVTQFSTSGPT